MDESHIFGFSNTLKNLNYQIKNESPSHAYIFSGPQNVGKSTLAKSFSKKLIDSISPQNPDFIFKDALEPLKIKEVREIINGLSLSPYQSPYKICIIKNSESLNFQSQNALLKTIEEPPQKTILVLLTLNYQRLLPTIQSRCQIFNLKPLTLKEFKKHFPNLPESIFHFSQGRTGVIKEYLESKENYEKHLKVITQLTKLQKAPFHIQTDFSQKLSQNAKTTHRLIEIWTKILRDILLEKQNCQKFTSFPQKTEELSNKLSRDKTISLIKHLTNLKDNLENTNINLRLNLDNFFLSLK